jgi:hypothetical protein
VSLKGFEFKPTTWQFSHLPLIYWPHDFMKDSWLFVKSQAKVGQALWHPALCYHERKIKMAETSISRIFSKQIQDFICSTNSYNQLLIVSCSKSIFFQSKFLISPQINNSQYTYKLQMFLMCSSLLQLLFNLKHQNTKKKSVTTLEIMV